MRVCSLTLGWSFRTRETVWWETPASLATSVIAGSRADRTNVHPHLAADTGAFDCTNTVPAGVIRHGTRLGGGLPAAWFADDAAGLRRCQLAAARGC